ncbi:MAG: FAD:protein FMN transferase [Actinobacteria bacterium]|nr:FAD:protein FMN transferase [Actinomycetota bacterium]
MTRRIASFRAMGTHVRLIGPAAGGARAAASAARAVTDIFAREDRRFSRFRPDSELSRVNAARGHEIQVSEPFAALLAEAIEAARRTGGLFDPTVLNALVAAGYDRDFDELLAGARGALNPPVACGRWDEIALSGDRVRLPGDVAIDLGGIAKGWTVDLAAEQAVAAGLPWALVNAGGDLRVAGEAPDLSIGIEDPGAPSLECARLALHAGALATSSVLSRPWGEDMHELIDPRTGSPADTGILQATVWAPTCAQAEVLAKVAILGGLEAVPDLPVALVRADGDLVLRMQTGEAA